MSAVKKTLRIWMSPSVKKAGAVQIGTGLLAIAALFSGVDWRWWLLALFGYFMYAGVGHSVGYHRYFSHRSFNAPAWAEVLFTMCGVLGCVGPPITWSLIHRQHHLHSDKAGDSYTAHEHPRLTFSALLVGNYRENYSDKLFRRALRRSTDFQRYVLRNYYGIVAGFALLLLLADWRLFMFGWAVPVALTLWMSALDAYATHHWGYQRYETDDESRNLWWMALLFWGEGWHNNHHAKPLQWNFGEKWWELDIGSWIIRGLLAIEKGRLFFVQLCSMTAIRKAGDDK